jgi:hypothetical protein
MSVIRGWINLDGKVKRTPIGDFLCGRRCVEQARNHEATNHSYQQKINDRMKLRKLSRLGAMAQEDWERCFFQVQLFFIDFWSMANLYLMGRADKKIDPSY